MAIVSVIVPVHKPNPEWLNFALESVRSQTYPVELVVVEDTESKGAWDARNRGLERATGDYIAFCDADDYMEPYAIERMVAAMDGVDMVVGSFRKFGEWEQTVSHPQATWDMGEVARYVIENLWHPMNNQLLSGCWAKLYRRHFVDRFPALTTAEDMAFNFDYLARTCSYVRVVEDVVYNNRKHSASLSTTFDERDKGGLFRVLEALRYVRRFLVDYNDEAIIDSAIDHSKAYHAMLYYMRICNQTKLPMREVLMKLYA